MPIYLPGLQTPLPPDLIITPAYSDPINDAGPDLSCLRPELSKPHCSSVTVSIASVCAPTAVRSVYRFADADIKTGGSSWEVLIHSQLLLLGLL